MTNFLAKLNREGTYDIVSLGLDGKPAGAISQSPIADPKLAVKQANKFNRNYGFEPTTKVS